MPNDPSFPSLGSPFEPHFGEIPLTRVLDLEDTLKVDVVQRIPSNIGYLLDSFTRCCHAQGPSVSADPRVLKEVLAGGGLWQSMEIMHMTLLVTGCTRVLTHQLVRQRVGVTFSQHCTGETDLRHRDLLIPRSWLKDTDMLQARINNAVEAKHLYAEAVDSREECLQEARYMLPHNLDTFIYVHACVSTLAQIYAKRHCKMTQAWETVLFARKMKEAILAYHPWLGPAFLDNCKSCWYSKARSTGFSCTHLYAPSGECDDHSWNSKTFVHGVRSHEEMSSGPTPVSLLHMVGREIVEEDEYLSAAREYKLYKK